jgi:hypothetical protein
MGSVDRDTLKFGRPTIAYCASQYQIFNSTFECTASPIIHMILLVNHWFSCIWGVIVVGRESNPSSSEI